MADRLPGEFWHAAIERRVGGGHRGLFATVPLPAGELLMVAKGLRHPAPRSSGGMASVDVPDLLDLIDALPAEVRAWLLVACQGMHPTEPAEVLSLTVILVHCPHRTTCICSSPPVTLPAVALIHWVWCSLRLISWLSSH